MALRKKRSLFKRLSRTIIVLCSLFLIWFIYALVMINGYPKEYKSIDSVAKADTAIILGAALWRDKPSPALQERLDAAIQLYEAGKVKTMILSGGQGGLASTISEAEGMKRYLVEHGVKKEHLLLDNESVNTFQNLHNSQAIMEQKKIQSAIIVTHDFHLARSLNIAKYLGYSHVQGYTVKSKVLHPIYHQMREVVSVTKWKVEWLLLKSKIISPQAIK